MFGLTVVTQPTAEPLTVSDARRHLRVDLSDDDPTIAALITAAREYVEIWCGLSLMTQTLRLTRDYFPRSREGFEIRLPRGPVQSVTSIKYTDDLAVLQTVAAADYVVDLDSQPARIALAYGEAWPDDTSEEAGTVKITYVAGYASADLVPQRIKQAMLLLVGHWYYNREATGSSTSKEIDLAVRSLLGVSYTGSMVGSFG